MDLITKEMQEEDAKTKEMFIHGSQKDACKGDFKSIRINSQLCTEKASQKTIMYHTILCSCWKSVGFGGKYGLQSDRVDKSAVGWEHHESVEKHPSQKGDC